MPAHKPYILGIDTSCDETSCAILEIGSKKVLSNVVSSQIKLHAPYGGVVPELASRSHIENISAVFQGALDEASVMADQIGAVAVTKTPGLIGCLLVGASFARAFAYRHQIPLFGVNHLMGHLFSPFIDRDPVFPSLGLVVSGGHTNFYLISSFSDIKLLGQTVDDAAGEAFDKAAKMMGLGYPGGPVVDKLAKQGDDRAFGFTIAKVKLGEQYLSFSGLKTAVYHHVRAQTELTQKIKEDLCASLQKSIVETLVRKMAYFVDREGVASLSLSGGVALNSLLRRRTEGLCDQLKLPGYVAQPRFCSDNGAMIAFAALVSGTQDERLTMSVAPSRKVNAREL
ncbi:MAG: hypothetical protein ACD_62C00452G0004 [uncultured bacterium]|nr:MAG: hypothetical protein ACD_62C00452G0004 [uncultured bacterium]